MCNKLENPAESERLIAIRCSMALAYVPLSLNRKYILRYIVLNNARKISDFCIRQPPPFIIVCTWYLMFFTSFQMELRADTYIAKEFGRND